MKTDEITPLLATLFSELVDGAKKPGGAFVLNSGDVGFLKSIEKLSAADASRSVNGGATIAAHVQHVRYGLSLMNKWGKEGGDPFSDAKWDEAWKVSAVDDPEWNEIRSGMVNEAHQWLEVFRKPRNVNGLELTGMIGSIAHLAYHMGAIRQIDKSTRGPREGTFKP
jgi:hypothetical protein